MMGDSSLEYTCMHDRLCIQALEFVYSQGLSNASELRSYERPSSEQSVVTVRSELVPFAALQIGRAHV